MDKVKEFYDKYSIYLKNRHHLEILAVTAIVLSIIFVFTSGFSSQGSLSLDKGTIQYKGTLVRGKMNGQGKLTFQNGDSYTGEFKNGVFDGKGTFVSQAGWKYEGEFSNGQADGQGTLTTESNVVYKGKFKQGIYQNAH